MSNIRVRGLIDLDTEQTTTVQALIDGLNQGSELVDTLSSGAGATIIGDSVAGQTAVVTQAQLNKSDYVPVEFFGAIGNGIADDTAAFNAAFSSPYRGIKTSLGKTYNISAITIPNSNTHLYLSPGSVLSAQVATNRAITVAGTSCSITGPGMIRGQAVFDGSNVRPTYALIWVTGDYFKASEFTIDTIPKEGLMFEDSTYFTVDGVRIVGRYPYASYNEASTTNHCGILVNSPDSATKPSPFGLITNTTFESCIQGVLSLNYGGASNNSSLTISDSKFKNCWDHGIYSSRSLSCVIADNTFLDCRRPIVVDALSASVTGNTLRSDLVGVSNNEQMMSVRECSRSIISNNTLHGIDAAIYLDCIETTDCIGNLISGNTINQTGVAFATSVIRMNGAITNYDNSIDNNTINCSALPATNYVIDLAVAAGAFGDRNYITNNRIRRLSVGGAIRMNRFNRVQIDDNKISLNGSAGAATTVNAILVTNSALCGFKNNTIGYDTGGTNITLNGINIDAGSPGADVQGTKFEARVSLVTPIGLVAPTGANLMDNIFDQAFPLSGTVTLPTSSGATSVVVNNPNCRLNSRVLLQATDSNAAAAVRNSAIWVTPGSAGFTLSSSAAVVGVSTFTYKIV